MYCQINNKYESLKIELQKVIINFDLINTILSKGTRNTIKIQKVEDVTLNIKSFKVPHLLNQIIYKYIRKSKAQRSFEYANLLIDKNIGTPEPIAYYENKNIVGLKDSYYICKQVDYNLTFRELVTDPGYQDHDNILRQFTKFTWQMHEQGIYFKDHSPGNTLIVKDNDLYKFYLVDLNRMDFFELDFNARMKNFSRLTPKKEMVKIMSDEYAKLSGISFEKVYHKMWFYTEEFQEKFHRKKRLKQNLLGRK